MTNQLPIVAMMIALLPHPRAVDACCHNATTASAEGIDTAQTRPGVTLEKDSRRFPPRDDSASNLAFAEFRKALLTAASHGDVAAILAATAAKVRVVDGTLSAEEFLKQEGVRRGQPWKALQEALELGSVSTSETTFVAPYLAVAQDLDGGETVAIGHNVRLRDSPSVNARVLANLDYDAVRVLIDHAADFESQSTDAPSAWAHVRTDSGATGYVFVRLLRSSTGPRFYFERVDGAWKLVAYSSGD